MVHRPHFKAGLSLHHGGALSRRLMRRDATERYMRACEARRRTPLARPLRSSSSSSRSGSALPRLRLQVRGQSVSVIARQARADIDAKEVQIYAGNARSVTRLQPKHGLQQHAARSGLAQRAQVPRRRRIALDAADGAARVPHFVGEGEALGDMDHHAAARLRAGICQNDVINWQHVWVPHQPAQWHLCCKCAQHWQRRRTRYNHIAED